MAAPYIEPDQATTLSKAVVRTVELLGMSQAELASVLGVSRATASRLAAGRYRLDPTRKEWELAVLFVRMWRSLVAITGPGAEAAQWLRGPNQALGEVPARLIGSTEGLVRTVQYLDAARARV